ncbi:UNVERIFIED_ORG: cation transport ATPase [Arthrobacter sp. UYCu721]
MSYREDNVTRMFTTSSKGSQAVHKDRKQSGPKQPYEPWYRAAYPWALVAVVIILVVVVWPSLIKGPGSFDFWLWSLVLVLLVAWAGSLFRSWWRHGRKRLNDRA